MNPIFNKIPLPAAEPDVEYHCGRGCYMLLYRNSSKESFDGACAAIEAKGFKLHAENTVKNNFYKTYSSETVIHIYFCESEKEMRIIADPNTNLYRTVPENCPDLCPTTLWQYEIDHSLIDCGMCIIVRCKDGSFFVIDSAHMYSVNDDIRIVEFLKKMNGGRKPVVAGWFFSHSHEDHIAKFLDIVEYHSGEIDIQAVYYNFPPVDHRDCGHWGECNKAMAIRFENVLAEHPEIKKYTLHSGQKFYIKNLEFTVLCTHEDVYPNTIKDYNNSSTSLMMTAEGCKVLFPGDSAVESDKVIVRRFGDYLKCDIVQVSHHGHTGTSPEFYRLANADCALFAVTQIKFDEELPRQEANRTAIALAKEYHIASNGTVEIPLPYKFGQTKRYPDETFEDFNGIFSLWAYEYTDERKEQLYKEFLERSKK